MENERELVDVDKLIEESTGLYMMWWIVFKEKHPDLCLIREKEPAIPPLPKPKVTFQDLSRKRCGNTWTPRSNQPPIQCPKCRSPYWNRPRKKPR